MGVHSYGFLLPSILLFGLPPHCLGPFVLLTELSILCLALYVFMSLSLQRLLWWLVPLCICPLPSMSASVGTGMSSIFVDTCSALPNDSQ